MIVDASEEPLVVRDGQPVFEFQTTGGSSWAIWDRFLSLRGGLRFHVGNFCNTCDFFFGRVSEGTPDTEPPRAIGDVLNAGVSSLQEAPIPAIGAMLPDGEYRVVLSVGSPHLVRPGDADDFFVREQIELHKIDPAILRGPIHDPATAYYRSATVDLGDSRAFYEFIVPTIPPDRLRSATIDAYRKRLGTVGTALAVSFFDVKAPALFDDSPPLDVTEHWILTHYLLDGNHKVNAASIEGRPVSILSFIPTKLSLATEEQFSEVMTLCGCR